MTRTLSFAPVAFPAVLLAALLTAHPVAGQGAAFTVEARGGAVLPMGSFADGTGVGEGVSAGPLFGAGVTLNSGAWRTWYVGFTQARFGCEDIGCPAGGAYVATGMNAGLRVRLVPYARVIPWVGIGGVTTRIESPGVTGSPEGTSTLGYGVEAGFGLWVRASGVLAINPSVRYTRAGTDMPGGVPLTLRYLVADLGLTLIWG